MTLAALIRKRDTGNTATAIAAIPATQPKEGAATVARIATVAVAKSPQGQTVPTVTVSPDDTAIRADSPEVIAERAIAMAALTDEQRAARLTDLHREPAIAGFWALLWPEASE